MPTLPSTSEVNPETERTDIVAVASVVVKNRIREELGDIDGLVNSIRKYGIIQPIVLERTSLALIAGGRRLTAVQRLGIKELIHAKDFIFRDELDPKRLLAIELEENIRRKQLTWQEEVTAKKKLLEDLQDVYGVRGQNRPEKYNADPNRDQGFSINKLAAILNEPASQISKDITVANAIAAMPHLAKADSKGAVYTRLRILGNVATLMTAAHTALKLEPEGSKTQNWTLYKGDFRDNVAKIQNSSIDFIHTDLPYGASVEKMSSHLGQPGFDDSRQTAISLLSDVARESFRVLKDNTYAAFWFGFNYYPELVSELQKAGFTVPPVPLIWVKNTKSGENPTTRYSNSYEACLIAVKGRPVLIRPGASNVKSFPVVTGTTKTHVAEKPVDLILDILRDCVPQQAVILDFMSGTGSTGVAAIRHNSKVVMFEKDPSFCSIIEAKMRIL